MPNHTFIRDEVTNAQSRWNLVDDCIAGQERIKKAKTTYLPKPNASDTSEENTARYNAYVQRALYVNYTNRTLKGLLGTVFDIDPAIHIHEDMEPIMEDVTGDGVPLVQQAKKATKYALAFGRGGLLTDYPTDGDPTIQRTVADQEAGYLRPTISLYQPDQIINWRTRKIGAKAVLSLVVLKEQYVSDDDGFAPELKDQYRALRLDESGKYYVEIYRDGAGEGMTRFDPKDSKGQPFDHIPFHFFGAENNDVEIDDAPLYDLAVVNVAHYRNSADYEESVFIVGQPTPYIAGLTKNWVDNVLGGEIQLGSRAAVPLPEGGSMGIVQAEANSMAAEAMEKKEDQMIAIGAKIIERAEAQRTATEVNAEAASEHSVLGTVAQNVSDAYTKALFDCTLFMGLAPEVQEDTPDGGDRVSVPVGIALSTEFDNTNTSPEARRQIVEEWNQGAITFGEMRDGLREAGVASVPDEDAAEEIRNAKDEENARAIELARAKKPEEEAEEDGGEPADD